MKVTLTGATGRIGGTLVAALLERGDEVTVLTRSPEKAREKLGDVQAFAWDLKTQPAPAEALTGRDVVVHLAGEDVGQRWTDAVKREILESRELGTRNLVAGIAAAEVKPPLLVSASASGYYGPRGDEQVDEKEPAGTDFLAEVCVAWEREAEKAAELGTRVIRVRTGIVLDEEGGALSKMLTPFKLGAGGPIAGGKQYMPWISLDDEVGLLLAAIDSETFSGPINASAPTPVTNKEFGKALGRALHRPAVAPTPGFAIKAMFGEMSTIVINGVRMVPGRAPELGYEFRHANLDDALSAALA
ncbi:TIGR01777 family oxidoreductase [Svornostia abyssi]|uniref:TIGR01777 family oxidoreductase n=1 Tax=Svornostia abyssi TaxID=2898438 RepID=A0ABY5PDT9_9ACTN|nr:TIGR01777 family oxidoreductase [Parviterribacteraceae bacterium J379]